MIGCSIDVPHEPVVRGVPIPTIMRRNIHKEGTFPPKGQGIYIRNDHALGGIYSWGRHSRRNNLARQNTHVGGHTCRGDIQVKEKYTHGDIYMEGHTLEGTYVEETCIRREAGHERPYTCRDIHGGNIHTEGKVYEGTYTRREIHTD